MSLVLEYNDNNHSAENERDGGQDKYDENDNASYIGPFTCCSRDKTRCRFFGGNKVGEVDGSAGGNYDSFFNVRLLECLDCYGFLTYHVAET